MQYTASLTATKGCQVGTLNPGDKEVLCADEEGNTAQGGTDNGDSLKTAQRTRLGQHQTLQCAHKEEDATEGGEIEDNPTVKGTDDLVTDGMVV